MVTPDAALIPLLRAIAAGDVTEASDLLAVSPHLAKARLENGATRAASTEHFLVEIGHYVYAGDTALHVAAAAYQGDLVRQLSALGADVGARNRRGAQPLHYAADGAPGSTTWNPRAQADTINCLIAAGADPNATDKGGVTPLHRAVRTRCAAAVNALLDGGAEPGRTNNRGSTPMQLATRATGRGGSGSAASKAQQQEILEILRRHGVKAG